jgi:hypothetical protein
VEKTNSTQRLIAKVLRGLVQAESFVSYADLVVDLREHLLRLRIRYQPHEFDDAISLVGSNRSLVNPPRPIVVPPPIGPAPVTRDEAARIWAELIARFRAEHAS